MASNRNAISTRQVDWNCDDQSSPEYIKNKPTTKPVVAGDNVSIEETEENFKISASGGGSAPEYVAGDGITISGDTISVNTDAIQTKLTAGTNIEINSGIISTGKSVVAAGSNVSVESSLDSLTNTVTYTVSGNPQVQSSWTESNIESPAYIQNKPSIPDEQVLVFRDYDFNRDRVKAAFDSGKIVFCNTKFSRDTNKMLRLYLTGYDQTKIDDVDYEIYWFSSVEPYYSATSVQYANAEFNMPATVFYYNKSTGTVTQQAGSTWQCKQPDWNESDPTADNYIKNKPTIPSSSDRKYAIDESNNVTWDDTGSYSVADFTLKHLDCQGIEYVESDNKYTGFILEVGHLYQVNFDCILSHYGYYNKMMGGEIWISGPLSQHWYFYVDDSQSGTMSITGSFVIRCKSSNETNLKFHISFDDVLTNSHPNAYMSGISIVDLGVAATA